MLINGVHPALSLVFELVVAFLGKASVLFIRLDMATDPEQVGSYCRCSSLPQNLIQWIVIVSNVEVEVVV